MGTTQDTLQSTESYNSVLSSMALLTIKKEESTSIDSLLVCLTLSSSYHLVMHS